MNSQTELLPCPFCGSVDLRSGMDDFGYFLVYCNQCGGTMEDGIEEKAITAWNTRATPAPSEKEWNPAAVYPRLAVQTKLSEGEIAAAEAYVATRAAPSEVLAVAEELGHIAANEDEPRKWSKLIDLTNRLRAAVKGG